MQVPIRHFIKRGKIERINAKEREREKMKGRGSEGREKKIGRPRGKI